MKIQRVFDKDNPEDAVKIVLTAQEMDALYTVMDMAEPLDDQINEADLVAGLHFAAYAFAVGDGELQ